MSTDWKTSPETCNLPWLNQEEAENLNGLVTTNKTINKQKSPNKQKPWTRHLPR